MGYENQNSSIAGSEKNKTKKELRSRVIGHSEVGLKCCEEAWPMYRSTELFTEDRVSVAECRAD